jgi:acyl-CoA thioesterase-1
MLRGLDPRTSYANLDAIIKKLKSRGVKVLLAGMQAPRNFGAVYADEFDAIYPRLAAHHDILLYPSFLDGVALIVHLNQPDGMHPNSDGVVLITERILPVVKKLLAQLRPSEIEDGG